MKKKPQLSRQKTLSENRCLLQLMLRAQQFAEQDAVADRGYSMMLTSIVSILLFSMLGAYLTMTNITKSATGSLVDSNNNFYVAESGLNRRADDLRQKFIGYAQPSGQSPGQGTNSPTSVTAANIVNCFTIDPATPPPAPVLPANPTPAQIAAYNLLVQQRQQGLNPDKIVPADNANTYGTADFKCTNYVAKFAGEKEVKFNSDGSLQSNNEKSFRNGNDQNLGRYIAYTFVKDNTTYDPTTNAPVPARIPSGQTYAGLNSQEYKYTVYSTAALNVETLENGVKKVRPNDNGSAKTVLELSFKSRVIPLFQFAAFYNGDLEINSTSKMNLGGWVHTNGNLYIQPTPLSGTGDTIYFYSSVTSAGNIYNRVDASTINNRYASPLFLSTGSPYTSPSTATYFPSSYFRLDMSLDTSLTPTEISNFAGKVKDGQAGATVLQPPDAGFLRKRNYYNNKVGEYYAKADLRLEMVPDRDVTSKSTAPWTRNTAIIPFNFTSIQTGGSGACTNTLPAAGSTPATNLSYDPAANYIPAERINAANLKCNVFTKGQLQSLRQPVLVLTNLKQSTTTLQTAEATILGRPTLPTTLPSLSTGANNATTKNQILRALQVALISTPSPVTLEQMNIAFSNTSYGSGHLLTFKTEFSRLINTISTLTTADRTNLLAASPNAIAALQSAWFLPAPIQRVSTNSNPDSSNNSRSSGFYDGRERRWITMLQTNIASLSVWNRDGLYVEATTATSGTSTPDPNLTTAYQTNNDMKNAAFNSGNGANFTDGLAFVRTTANTTLTTINTLKDLGLGAVDSTEGGLVFYATVSDDLKGDGNIIAAEDVTIDTANPILKQKADGTNVTDANGNPVIIDYPRKYQNGNTYQSPFGFAFNGGDYLPASLSLVTDRAMYVQGNFNNNGATQPTNAANTPSSNRLPAAILGDTITVLSNQCLASIADGSIQSSTNHLAVPAGQIDCGLPRSATGSVDITAGGVTATYYSVTAPTAVNAAFLSYTDRSIGNLGTNRGYTTSSVNDRFSGGLNNYMRMLENWGQNQYFNYSGSFVSLGTPLEYSGTYLSGGTYYNIPVRNFNYDTNFDSFNNLPPLTPRAIYLQQQVFKRTYN